MGKLFLGTILLALTLAMPMKAKAEVFVDINVGLPPVIEFAAPPELIVLPGTYVYVAPDVNEDIYFYGGWWWRPWGGHWYRSRHYGSGWVSYRSVPSFYRGIHSGWRDAYRTHQWQGHRWDYQRIPHRELNRNWKGWEKNRHWEQKKHWGVEGYRHQPQTHSTHRAAVHTERSKQPKKPERGAVKQQERKSHSRQPDQNVQSRHSRPQKQQVKSEKSHKKSGKRQNEEDGRQGRK